MLNEVNFKSNDNILPPPATDEYCGTSDEFSPTQDQEELMIMLKYIRNKECMKDQLKAYPTFKKSVAPANLLRLEQTGHLCCGNFSKPLSVSTIVTIMTLQGLFIKLLVFCKEMYSMCSFLSL